MPLNCANTSHQLEKESREMDLKILEEVWQHIRCESLKAQNEASSREDVQKEIEELKLWYKRLKEEHASFRDLADRMTEEKDKEISKLLEENKNLQ
ncbi:hypothetical protein SLA2020_242930 [Shorea laevis]